MANTFLTPRIVAMEALRILESEKVYRDLVFNDYSNEFAMVGDTVNVRKRNPLKAKTFVDNIETQDITEAAVPVKLDRYRDVSVQISSKDLTLDIKNFSEQVVKPAMIGLEEQVDAEIAAFLADKVPAYITATTNPTDLADVANMAKTLDKNKAPKADRHLVFAPDHKYNYALTENLSKVSYAGDSLTLRDALLGKVYGFNTYMDQNNLDSNTGNATAFSVTGTINAKTVALASVTPASAQIKTGDVFLIDGHAYHFAEDKTASGGAVASIKIEEPLHKAVNAEAAKVVTKPISVGFQREAVAFVSRPLETPQGAVKSYTAQGKNIAVRVTFGYNMQTKQDIVSFDILFGLALLNEKLLVGLK